ncbi:CRISPR associated protein Cas2 [Georgenia satyanarayanai]|uniref:CRISPR associated protein Cas2 n=1 Tax=Georgenia satyanarayanai TaxID=860221 RepID=A0A2Y9C4Y7_9MICO|nr:CRISPR-associated endonuclease Cas2 [Georgenia satyanarayanai]PYG00174.1 CRISPR associated protein Cas2 family [Georgenia satyanarayanai]SSA40403.1 CRISPR associated protein Cas2 [Georgenia satyanarayanai]
MTTYLVTYDLTAPGRNYDDLYEAIKSYGTWAHVVESVWEICSDTTTAAHVRDHLGQFLDGNDKIFVTVVGRESAWRGLRESLTAWLKKNHGE